jgi:chromosome segregation ATPase
MSSTDKEHYIQSYQTAVSEEDDLNKSNVAAIHTKYDSSIASMESELQNLGISQSDYEARKVALENYQKEYDRAVQSGDEEKIQSTQQEIDQLSAEISQYETIRDKLNELNTQLDAELSEEDARHQTALKKIENDYIFIQQYL